MSEWIIVRTGQAPDEAASWARIADGGAVVDSGRVDAIADLESAAARFGEEARVAAILPGEQAAMRFLPSPPRQASKLKSAANFLLEDELALPIEEQHVAIARNNGEAVVAAIAIAQMREWTEAFSAAGLPLAAMSIDYLCLGGALRNPVLFVEGERVTGIVGAAGFAAEAALAEPIIASFLAENADARVGVYKMGDTGDVAGASEYEYLGESGDNALLRLAAAALNSGAAANLLQGPYKPARRNLIDAGRWRRPAMMAASLALLMLAGVVADGVRAGRIADRYEAEAARIHNEAFPGAGGNIRANARAVLAGGAAGGPSFLAISGLLGRALDAHDEVSIDRIRYDSDAGATSFSIRSSSDTEIAAFRETLSNMGARTEETGGYRRLGEYWVGEMRVVL